MSTSRYDGATLAAMDRHLRRGHHVHLVIAHEGRPRSAALHSADAHGAAVHVMWEDARTLARIEHADILSARTCPRHATGQES